MVLLIGDGERNLAFYGEGNEFVKEYWSTPGLGWSRQTVRIGVVRVEG